jgi:hypothetical protein
VDRDRPVSVSWLPYGIMGIRRARDASLKSFCRPGQNGANMRTARYNGKGRDLDGSVSPPRELTSARLFQTIQVQD